MKKLQRYLQVGVVIFGAVVYAIACQHTPFTPAECAIIGSADEGPMPVLTVENPDDSVRLHAKSRPLSRSQASSALSAVLKGRMLQTVNASESGVGLAAPQVGIPCRLIVVQRVDLEGEPWRFYVNPEITDYSDETAVGGEGCFSVSTRRGMVERSQRITIHYNDEETFAPKTETIEGFAAVIFQHEIDHLDGTLFTDRAVKIISAE